MNGSCSGIHIRCNKVSKIGYSASNYTMARKDGSTMRVRSQQVNYAELEMTVGNEWERHAKNKR